MGGRIDAYLDVASLYSYVAFLLLVKDAPVYAANNVEVVYHPILLGAINKATGNKPPFSLPAKAAYGMYDVRRSCARVGAPETQAPPDFMKRAVTVLALRALHYIQSHYSAETYVAAFHYLFYRFWTPEHADLRDPEILKAELRAAPAGFNGKASLKAGSQNSKPLFTAADVDAIVAGATSQPAKDQLTAATTEALDRGAYGAPWLWVTNDAGDAEPFFGSDRFHFVYQFLGLPYQDVVLVDAPVARAGKL
ncbi:thioredoxin [Sporothrix schenckii 1099-18]|uniref:Glutathione S-transferase kappa n=2 Tax=Sporothrix schenckii TaxID=29908 RepID=U7PTE1_SPOS1|nr:thioredoxin [Sporothrix schenckii 1099-18]ERS97745.1 hypothetical protein HMPREF1624_05916 [Sporothrix schenckii ATCC 58251]KJR82289.1 thioredoxin [Sporothrix schenckii 1099-18]